MHHRLLWVIIRGTQIQKVISLPQILTQKGYLQRYLQGLPAVHEFPKFVQWLTISKATFLRHFAMFLGKTHHEFPRLHHRSCIFPAIPGAVFTTCCNFSTKPFSLVAKHGNGELDLQKSSRITPPIYKEFPNAMFDYQTEGILFGPAFYLQGLVFSGLQTDLFSCQWQSEPSKQPRRKRDRKVTVSCKTWACVFCCAVWVNGRPGCTP